MAQAIAVLPGIFAAFEVLPLDVKPAHNVADLLVQEAADKGGIQ